MSTLDASLNLDESVREDVHRNASSPFVPDGALVRGFVCDVHSGLLTEVAVDAEVAA
jgi:hypothetical protein